MRCTFGDKKAKLTVYPDRTVFLTGQPMANISDHISLYNIAGFGKCHTTRYPATGSATAANHGRLTPMPCVPGTNTEWKSGKDDYLIKGDAALLKSSYCKCRWGGVITITDDGQKDTGAEDMSRVAAISMEQMLMETEEKEKQGLKPEAVLDGIQLALDAAGFVPGFGAIPDLTNAAISALRGNWLEAGMSVLAAVPVIGDAAAGAKSHSFTGLPLNVKLSTKSSISLSNIPNLNPFSLSAAENKFNNSSFPKGSLIERFRLSLIWFLSCSLTVSEREFSVSMNVPHSE